MFPLPPVWKVRGRRRRNTHRIPFLPTTDSRTAITPILVLGRQLRTFQRPPLPSSHRFVNARMMPPTLDLGTGRSAALALASEVIQNPRGLKKNRDFNRKSESDGISGVLQPLPGSRSELNVFNDFRANSGPTVMVGMYA